MPLLLRKIRSSRWDQASQLSLPTLASMQADAFVDLRTQSNKLSLWHVEDDSSNLSEVLTALAANSDDLSNIDYALFDGQLVLRENITIESTKGDTPCEQANKWHRDLVQLTGQQLTEVALIIMRYGAKDRISERRALSLVLKAASSGAIDTNKLSKNLKAKVNNSK